MYFSSFFLLLSARKPMTFKGNFVAFVNRKWTAMREYCNLWPIIGFWDDSIDTKEVFVPNEFQSGLGENFIQQKRSVQSGVAFSVSYWRLRWRRHAMEKSFKILNRIFFVWYFFEIHSHFILPLDWCILISICVTVITVEPHLTSVPK